MTTISDLYQAGIDAIVADNTINMNGFADATAAVVPGISNAESDAWVIALLAEYLRLGLGNGNYSNLRSGIISDSIAARELFDALAVSINGLPESVPLNNAASLFDLREDRDQVDAAITRCDVLIAAEPSGTVGRLVKDILRDGKRQLRQYKQQIRDQIQNLTGDPDS
jgi:hypothetical protein